MITAKLNKPITERVTTLFFVVQRKKDYDNLKKMFLKFHLDEITKADLIEEIKDWQINRDYKDGYEIPIE